MAHYFTNAGKHEGSTSFQCKGRPVDESGGKNVPVKITQTVTAKKLDRQENSRTHAEWIQLAIVVLVALLGLMAGAQEQLAKLDVIPASVALFLLRLAPIPSRTR